MAGTINDFRSSFNAELARPSRFDVTIPVPVSLANLKTSAKNLTFRCETAAMPGRTFETATKKLGSAPIEYFPYHNNYQQATMTFIVSDDMNEKIFFDSWMELINPTTTYNFEYKVNYATDITITQYNSQGQPTYAGILQEAFPIDVNQLDLDWSTDSYHKLSVVFVYKQWQNNSVAALRNNIITNILSGALNSF
jgi:hypothetical protein